MAHTISAERQVNQPSQGSSEAEGPIGDLLGQLSSGRPDSAWSEFLNRFSAQIFHVARQFEHDHGRATDCFLYICEQLSDNGFRPDGRAQSVNAADCQAVYRSEYFNASWGARDGTIYLLKPAGSGSGTSLYRLTLATNSVVEVWSRGTMFTVLKATLDSDERERVAVSEHDPLSACTKALVIDADTCSGSSNNCMILNGQGHPARYLTWLRNGRVAAESQSVPNRKGKCAIGGRIVTFDTTDSNGTTTTLNQGLYPNGSGGG